MTNDDRSNDDRTADGQAPRWGEPQQQPAQDDAPRYGERITPASAPQYGEQAAPQQYGSQQQGSQQYGQSTTPSWNDQQQHQPYATAPASAGAPAWQAHDEPKRKKKTVGVIAFVAAVIALVVGVIGGYVLGTALGASGAFKGVLDGTGATADPQQLQNDVMNDPAIASKLAVGSVLMWVATLFGVWAIVQGIVAIATKRGRGWGVFALVLAVVAALVAGGVYIGIAVSTSGSVS